jgi:hypothetical protein
MLDSSTLLASSNLKIFMELGKFLLIFKKKCIFQEQCSGAQAPSGTASTQNDMQIGPYVPSTTICALIPICDGNIMLALMST